jgi:transposase
LEKKPVRATTLVKQILGLKGVVVSEVSVSRREVVVNLKLSRAKLLCPKCSYSTRSCYDTKTVDSRWRHLDMGARETWLSCSLRRLKCPRHGVITESVSFARPVAESRFTRDFEHLVAWCTSKLDKTTVTKLTRIAWRTVGMICERVVAEELDPKRLENLFSVGVDEISYRKHHSYLTLVTNHDSGKIIYGSEGKSATSLDGFFSDLGPQRAAKIEAVTMDMGPAFAKAFREHAPGARICLDPFHVVKLGTEALEEVRKDLWRQMRRLPSPEYARKFGLVTEQQLFELVIVEPVIYRPADSSLLGFSVELQVERDGRTGYVQGYRDSPD